MPTLQSDWLALEKNDSIYRMVKCRGIDIISQFKLETFLKLPDGLVKEENCPGNNLPDFTEHW